MSDEEAKPKPGSSAEVIRAGKAAPDEPDIENINDPDALRRIAAKRHIAFAPHVTVARMKRRLLERAGNGDQHK